MPWRCVYVTDGAGMRLRRNALTPTLFAAAGALALLAPASIAAAAQTPGAVSLCLATAHHEDAFHDGNSCTSLPAQPTQKWSVTLNGSASYPVIAGGKVFVATAVPGGSYGGWLYALNASTGKVAWGPVPLGATYYWFALAYGDGNVYVNNFDGTVTAYNATTGRQVWAQATNYFSGEPVAYKGVLYLQGAGPVFALSEKTGKVIWESSYLDGDGSSVSANASGVYVAAGCSWFRLSLATGAVVWSGNSGCTGGGGGTTYLSNGMDFETVGNFVVNATTGKTRGTFSGVPAFSGTNGYFANGTSVFCENVKTLTPVFTAPVPAAVATSPVIAGQSLYVGAANSEVYALSTTTGKVTWHAALPGVPGGGAQYSSPTSDIAVGQGLLVVPTGDQVTAFG
jgi:outer membrane protein assembly factor BamB